MVAIHEDHPWLGEAEGRADVTAGGREVQDLRLEAATAETITVVAEAPRVDKFNITAGSTVSGEIGERMVGTTRTH